jgi:HEAT repeat protein
MAKSRGVDAKLSRLKTLRSVAITPEVVAELRQSLGDPSNFVAAEAADIAGTRGVADLALDLVAAFDRFMIEPEKSDKLCRAKTAIVEALNKLEYDKPDVFLPGIRHVQEPIFGTDNDMAGSLRGNSAFGLVRINFRGVLILLADLLLDRDIKARTAAVQALGETGSPAALPLLRFKARIGDKDPGITGECLTALIHLEPIESLPFVTEFLHSGNEAIQEGAALALAESRRPEALQTLKDFWPQARHGASADVVLLAIAMSRLPAALDFLLEVLDDKNDTAALAALNALAIHRHNDQLRDRVAAMVAKRGDVALQTRFEKKFSRKE